MLDFYIRKELDNMFTKNDMRIIKNILVRCSRENLTSMQNITLTVFEYKTIKDKGLPFTLEVIQYIYNKLN